MKIVLQAIDDQKGKAKGIHLNFIINLLSPSKKNRKETPFPNPFPMKGQGGGWRRKKIAIMPHTAIASCPFTGNVEEIAVPKEEGKDVRRTERGRF